MTLSLIKCSDTLLQRQKRFIDLCSVYTSLLIHVHVIRSSFITCQIDKGNLSVHLFALP